jgi:hypothetical protein
MAIQVDQQRLVLNAFAAVFQNNLVSADAVTWRQYDSELSDRNALTVSEQVGPRYAVTQTTAVVQDLTTGTQDSIFGSEQFKVDQVFGVSMGWDDFVKVRDVGEARQSVAIKNAATRLAETIDAYILRTASFAANNWIVGATEGLNVADLGDVASAYTRLKEEGVDDADLRAILTYADRQALSETIVAYPAPDSLSTTAFRKGFEGEVNGIPTMFTQQLPLITVGTRTKSGISTVNGAAQNVNYKAVSTSAAPGQYLTQTLLIKVSAAGVETVAAGEVFTIAGVNAYDNRLGASLGRLQQFTVISAVTAVAGAATVRIFPAIVVPGTGSGGDINVNNAHATVDTVPGAAAAITWVGVASTAYKPRVMMQKEAIVCMTAPLIKPATGMAGSVNLTKVPLNVRMWTNSDFNTGKHNVRFDVLLNANIRDRRRIVRFNGTP